MSTSDELPGGMTNVMYVAMWLRRKQLCALRDELTTFLRRTNVPDSGQEDDLVRLSLEQWRDLEPSWDFTIYDRTTMDAVADRKRYEIVQGSEQDDRLNYDEGFADGFAQAHQDGLSEGHLPPGDEWKAGTEYDDENLDGGGDDPDVDGEQPPTGSK